VGTRVAADEYCKVFARYCPDLQDELDAMDADDDTIDDYSSSAALNQPIWQLAQGKGFDFARNFYVRALALRSSAISDYAGLAQVLNRYGLRTRSITSSPASRCLH
jgi:hypothetical protein